MLDSVFLKNNLQAIVMIGVSVILFLAYSWFPYATTQENGTAPYRFKESTESVLINELYYPVPSSVAQTNVKFASPDATANYFWIDWFTTYDKLWYVEPYHLIAGDYIVPRSVRSDNGVVRPVSFLGVILIYAFFVKLFGIGVVPYLTPLFALFGLLAFYGITRRLFDQKHALIATLLLATLAPFWYYTSRGLFHNVLFVSFLLIAGWLLLYTRRDVPWHVSIKLGLVALSGIFLGLAIMTRTVELIWLTPALLITAALHWRQLHVDKVLLFGAGIIAGILPMLYYNSALYGSPLQFGYQGPVAATVMQESTATTAAPAATLPFGLDIENAVFSLLYYYVNMFWYLFWPAVLTLCWYVWKWRVLSPAQRTYSVIWVIVSGILVAFYGSWQIQDNINPTSVTIGNSYTRYWLPMYIMSLPLVAAFILRVTRAIQRPAVRTSVVGIVVVGMMVVGSYQAVWSREEGLASVTRGIAANKARTPAVLAQVEPEAVIVTQHHDKFFWPHVRVVGGDLLDNERNQALHALVAKKIPVYYYGFIFSPTDWDYLNNRKLLEAGLQIEEVSLDTTAGLGLYQLVLKKR